MTTVERSGAPFGAPSIDVSVADWVRHNLDAAEKEASYHQLRYKDVLRSADDELRQYQKLSPLTAYKLDECEKKAVEWNGFAELLHKTWRGFSADVRQFIENERRGKLRYKGPRQVQYKRPSGKTPVEEYVQTHYEAMQRRLKRTSR